MTRFSDLALDPKVLQAVSEAGYETPTPIQVQAIPHALEGRDVLGIAQTGTGKTASFVLPMITHLSKGRARARMPRSLVLAPTRELAAQVAENFEKYSKHVKLSMALLIGGVSFKDQDKLIDRGVDVLIATPGRLLDHFERGKLMLTGVQIMVVDEADRMLDMGFIPDIERIFKLVPFTRQTLFFSATMAPEITRITQEFLHNPVRVEVARQATTSETITQFVCKHTPKRRDSADGDKREVLRRLIQAEGDTLTNGIIFCNRKRDVDVLAKSLKKHGFDAAPLHGDLDQSLRTKILGDFRDGALKLLVASDVAARGLDIPTVSHVFNFDVPIHSEDYVHRIGRTGRAGRSGKAITLCFPHEEKYLAKIEELVKKTIPLLPSPLGTNAVEEAPVAEAEAPAPRRERSRRSESRGEPRAEGRTREERAEPAVAEAAVDHGRSRVSEPRGGEGRGGEGRGGEPRGGRRDRGGDRPVLGMGDHVPAFLLREFRIEPTTFASETEDGSVIETPVAAEAPVAAPAVKEIVAAVAEAPAEVAEHGAQAEDTAPEPVVVDAPAPAEVTTHAETDAPPVPAAEPLIAEEVAEPVSVEAPPVETAPTDAALIEPAPVAAAPDAPEVEAAPVKPKKPRAPRKRTPKAKPVAEEAPEAPTEETAPAA